MKKFFLTLVFTLFASASAMAETTAHDFTLTGIDGKPMPLSQFKGHPVLVVNTASECGYTPQYEELEALWKAYKDKGLVILGVPSNDFGGQEPGSASEIATFCKLNYGVTFPLSDKTVVKGDNAHPFYKWAGEQAGMLGRPKWNFHKYLIERGGERVISFRSGVDPLQPSLVREVERLLDAK